MPTVQWTLRGREGDWRYQSIGDRFTIGREGNGADWSVPVKKISSRHATLEWREGAWWIRDNGSTNGTFINNVRLQPGLPHALHDGDSVRLDQYALAWGDDAEEPEHTVVMKVPSTGVVATPVSVWQRPQKEESAMAVSGDLARLVMIPQVPLAPAPKGAVRTAEQRELSRLKKLLQERVINVLDLRKRDEINPEEMEKELGSAIRECMRADEFEGLNADRRKQLAEGLRADMVRLGPLHPFLLDAAVTEILVYPDLRIWVERAGKLEYTGVDMDDHDHSLLLIERMLGEAGRRADFSQPTVTARLRRGPAKGCRLSVTLPPVCADGPTFTIRKFTEGLNLAGLLANQALSQKMAAYLVACVAARRNILVLGGTGSGKTTVLKSLAEYIPRNQRVLILEDTREIAFDHPLVQSREARPANIEGKGAISIYDLLVHSLRERPDRIIVGEVRGKEVLEMLQAMNTGHEGSMSTVHANSIADAMARLEIMMTLAAPDLPHAAAQAQICSALHVLVQVQRFADGTRRVSEIAELSWDEATRRPATRTIFEFHVDGFDAAGRVQGHYQPAQPTRLTEAFREYNVHLDPSVFTAA